MRTVNSFRITLLSLVGCCAGCTALGGGDGPSDVRLPFHVAVVGVAKVQPSSSDEPLMKLQASSRQLSTLLARELAERAFTRATVISAPAAGGVSALQQAVAESGADMVLLCELDYASPITYERTSPVVLNLALFLVGGPFIWFIDEYTYNAQAELKVDLYDLGGVDSTALLPGDPRSHILAAETSFAGVETDFVDRVAWGTKGAATSYLATLFTSTFLVGHEGAQVAAMVSREALSSLGAQVAARVLEQRDDVMSASSKARLAEVSLESLRVTYDGFSYVEIAAQVSLRSPGGKRRLTRCRVDVGGRLEDWRFGEGVVVGEGQTAVRRYDIRLLVPDVADNVATFRMVLMGGPKERVLRTYTMAIPPAAD